MEDIQKRQLGNVTLPSVTSYVPFCKKRAQSSDRPGRIEAVRLLDDVKATNKVTKHMDSNQDRIFADFEADRWFEMNKDALRRFDAAADFPIRLMTFYRLRPGRVLEVGACYGVRLAAISERYEAKTLGVEPSAKAMSEGRARFPDVESVQGVSHDIPLEEPFDLIIVNFVFHWVDRTRLLGTVAENRSPAAIPGHDKFRYRARDRSIDESYSHRMTMHLVGIIPAREGNKRIPRRLRAVRSRSSIMPKQGVFPMYPELRIRSSFARNCAAL